MTRKLAPLSGIFASLSVLIIANLVMLFAETNQFAWRAAAVITAIFLPLALLAINSYRIKHDEPNRL